MKRRVTLLTMLVSAAVPLAAGAAPANAAVLDGTCVASVTLNFSPPATQPLPPTAGPASTATGSGTITTCVFPGGGATTGTFSYALTGNLTCTSAQNVTGTLDIAWSDGSQTHATVTGLLSVGSVGGTAGLSATVDLRSLHRRSDHDRQPARPAGPDHLPHHRPRSGQRHHEPHVHAAALDAGSALAPARQLNLAGRAARKLVASRRPTAAASMLTAVRRLAG